MPSNGGNINQAARFWMVWNPNGRIPRFKHASRQQAQAEVERLAREHPGDVFFVLKAVGAVISTVNDPTELTLVKSAISPDEIPF